MIEAALYITCEKCVHVFDKNTYIYSFDYSSSLKELDG